MKTKLTDAQYGVLSTAARSKHGVYPRDLHGHRADVIERCQKNGWLSRVGYTLTARGFLVWREVHQPQPEEVAKVLGLFEDRAYREAFERQRDAEQAERNAKMFKPAPPGVSVRLSMAETYAIINALRHMDATYSPEYSGVKLTDLADILAAKALKEEERNG